MAGLLKCTTRQTHFSKSSHTKSNTECKLVTFKCSAKEEDKSIFLLSATDAEGNHFCNPLPGNI